MFKKKRNPEYALMFTEEEAMEMVQEAKDNQTEGGYTLTKGGYTAKPKKSKGEILYIKYKVTIEKTFE